MEAFGLSKEGLRPCLNQNKGDDPYFLSIVADSQQSRLPSFNREEGGAHPPVFQLPLQLSTSDLGLSFPLPPSSLSLPPLSHFSSPSSSQLCRFRSGIEWHAGIPNHIVGWPIRALIPAQPTWVRLDGR